jgi:hypothetical protein
MCRNHSHVAGLPLGIVVLTPHGWMQAYRAVQDLKIELPTGEGETYPPGTIFYVPSRATEESVVWDIPVMEGPTEVPAYLEAVELIYTATILESMMIASGN